MRVEHLEASKRSYEKYKRVVLRTDKEPESGDQFLRNDNFFMDEDEDEEQVEEEPEVQRKFVDRKGNILKNRHQQN